MNGKFTFTSVFLAFDALIMGNSGIQELNRNSWWSQSS